MLKLKWLAPLLLLLMTSCQSGLAGNANPCDGWAAIRPTSADLAVLSPSLKKQILAHDMHGADVCGWRA
jgi:hypothetical protein